MQTLAAITLAVLSTLSSQPDPTPPSIERLDLFTIEVRGTDYAQIFPEPIALAVGVPLTWDDLGYADADEGAVRWTIHPMTSYRVDATLSEERTTASFEPTREYEIQYTMYQIFALRDKLRDSLAADFFELREAIETLRDRGYIE